jgi:DNA recombination protein RmuC
MNEIIFMLGDWPVRTVDALIGFGALVLILLLVIAVVIARSGRRGAELAMANAIRADELEERIRPRRWPAARPTWRARSTSGWIR